MDRRFLSIISGVLFLLNSVCASVITIGTGTSTWSCPLSTEYIDSRAQTIYLASEIGAARTFKSLGLNVTTAPGLKMNNFTIRLKHTDLSSYGSTPTWESAGWTTVYQANQTVSTTGWVTFPFTTSFSFNGVQNLMVDISFNNTSYSSFGYCRCTVGSTKRTFAYGSKNNEADPLTWSGSTPSAEASNYITNIQLSYDPVMVTVPDVTGLSQADAQSAIASANLIVGTVTTSYHTTIPAGTVISQSPAGGQSAETQTPVNLVVSLGKIYSGGSGTAADPYIIASKEDLLQLAATTAGNSACFLLTEDLDLAGEIFSQAVIAPDTDTTTYGFQGVKFTGLFDGNNHKITNLTINTSTQDYAALFGYVGSGGQIKNLGLENINITGHFYVGGLAGYNYKGTVTSCYSTGNVTGYSNVGGLVGYNDGGTHTACYFGGSVSGSNAGGLAGYNYKGTLTSCYSSGSVSGGTDVGGLVGYNRGPVTDCYSISNIIGSSDVGGLVGKNDECQINSCYSAGSVSGSSFGIGGLVGSYYYGSVIASFWDIETSGQTTSGGGVGKTTLQMKDMFTYSSNNWGNDWTIDSGNDYPHLTWENAVGTVMTAPTITMVGSGTSGDPWIIASKEDFEQVCMGVIFWNKYYRLDVDIDLSGETYLVSLIGYDKNSTFTGGFDGNGHTISNLTINAPDRKYTGLFGYIGSGGQVKNLGLENINIIGSVFVGGLAGYNEVSTITACYSTGSITGQSNVGGLAGSNGGTLTSCYFSGSVSGSPHGQYVGGLVGSNGGTLTACYSTGSASGTSILYIGGLVGSTSGTLTSCYSSVSVSSPSNSEYIGGLAGAVDYDGVVTSCYSIGSVSGSPDSQYVGGLAGHTRGAITACYSIGSVSGSPESQSVGGLVGGVSSYGSVIACFWDIQTSGQTTSAGGLGKTTLHMKDMLTYGSSNWGSDWTIDSGNDYPHLAWENAVGTVIPAPMITMAGSGTAGDPWIIASKEDFLQVCAGIFFWNKHYRLDIDIDMSGSVYPFNLIGYDKSNIFTGVFDGNGHAISNLTIHAPTCDYAGLFGYIGSNGQVKNLGLENIHITGSSNVGGLVGYNYDGTITSCYSTGSVSGSSNVGGLVGYHSSGAITSCYSAVSVSGSTDVGGLVGYNYYYGTITSCYSIGSVSGSTDVGGLVGYISNSYKCASSFWDTETSGQTTSSGGIGKTTAEMQTQSTFTSAGWDFSNTDGNPPVWYMNGIDYPVLTWQLPAVPVPNTVGMTQSEAQTILITANFTVSITKIVSDSIPVGVVISQTPVGGTMAGYGSWVNLTVSLGKPVVPNVIGKTQVAAQTAITAASLTTGSITQIYSDSVAAGNVISQTPAAGTAVDIGSAVDLVVSKGKPVVPNVAGMSKANAQSAIISLSLSVGTMSTAYHNTIAAGNVISQTPASGTAVNIGSAVNLVVSLGKPVVPDITGKTQTEAQTAITAAGLVAGVVTEVLSDTVPAGIVISQSLSAGESVNVNTSINFVVSLGKRYSGGGTAENPYLISAPHELYIIGTNSGDWGKYFKLTNDIDMSMYTGAQYHIIGNATIPFTGTFDGDGYIICNLTYTNSNAVDYVGLFGYTYGAVIRNLGLENINFTVKGSYIGGLAGRSSGTITDCYVTGSITATSISSTFPTTSLNIGGLVGYNYGIIKNSRSESLITVSSSVPLNAGGLVGITYGDIANCCAEGSVASSYLGNVSSLVGGLAGAQYAGAIVNCYSKGAVYSSSNYTYNAYAGGLAGFQYNAATAKIVNCYSAGNVTGNIIKGGLLGNKAGSNSTVTSCFWDTQASGLTTSAGGTGVMGKTTAQMQTQSTFTSAGWDFCRTIGRTGNALTFDGIDDYVDVAGYQGIGGIAGRTCCAWVKTDTAQQSNIISWGGEQNGQRWLFRVDANGALALGVGGGYVATTATVNDGQWHHVAAVLDSDGSPSVNEILLYIDGILQSATASTTQPINTTASQNVLLGAFKNSGAAAGYFKGQIDDICIYNRALTAGEIMASPDDGLAARWAMDEISGGIVHDLISSYDGTLKSAGVDVVDTWTMLGYPHFSWETINPLQAEIDAASDGDTITVQPGIYQGLLNFNGKEITLTSANPQDWSVVASTIIRGLGIGPVVSFDGTETSACVLQGFTIENGSGSGIYGGTAASSATIRNCVIQNNTDATNGGGISNCNGLISNCIIRNNTATTAGSAMYQCGGQIINCTIVPSADSAVNVIDSCSGSFTNCIVTGIGSIFENCTGAITYSCYPGATGTGNIDADPLFVDAAGGDYHLLPDSPCIDAGDPASDYSNESLPNGNRIDMGAYGNTPEATLSREGLIPLGFVNVSTVRTGRTTFEYELAVTVRNTNDFDMAAVELQLKDWDAAVVSVPDDSVHISLILPGATVTSTDTFRIVVNRLQLVDSSRLSWELKYYVTGTCDPIQQSLSMPLSAIDKIGGDINSDGRVNLEDFGILAGQWEATPGVPSADISLPQDGYVGIEDLMYLAENWLR